MNSSELEALLQGQSASGGEKGTQERTLALKPVFEACKAAWESKSAELESLAEKLGDGSRDVNWRKPYGDSGILDLFVVILGAEDVSTGLKTQALRIAGNSCADTDENRAHLVEGNKLANISKQLDDVGVVKFAVTVLYNVMVDYEPAQKLASESGLGKRLLKLLSASTIRHYVSVVPYICKILGLLLTQQDPSASSKDEDAQAAHVLLTLALEEDTRDDAEEFASVVSVALAYLSSEGEEQAKTISQDDLSLFLDVFYHSQINFPAEEQDEDATAALKQLDGSILNVLADVTSQDSFSASNSLTSPVAQKFMSWLKGDAPKLQAAACLALGNLSRSDAASTALVTEYKLHQDLIRILNDPAKGDAQLLHASMSFLKNLAIPPQNKPSLAPLLEANRLPHIFTMDSAPQIQFASISLARLLLLNNTENIHNLCARGADGTTPLAAVISLFGRADQEPTKMEAARSVATVCRGLHSLSVPDILTNTTPAKEDTELVSAIAKGDKDSLLRHILYRDHPGMAKALAFLLTQDKWPVLRSEAWFVFALMARSADGALLVAEVLGQDGVMAVLTKAITGREPLTSRVEDVTESEDSGSVIPAGLNLEPQQVPAGPKADTAPVDRENAVVMCTELDKHWNEEECTAISRGELQALIKEGTALVGAYKASQ